MQQLLGEYECKMDAKGRMRLPSALISQLGDAEVHSFVINRGFENNLMLYPQEVWDTISAQINRLNQYNKKQRDFQRYFYRGAHKVTVDSADRILVNKRLLEYAGIQKDVILAAVNNRIEIWAKEQYDILLDNEPEDFSDLAQDVLGGEPLNDLEL